MGRHFAPAIAADRQDREPLAGTGVAGPVDVAGDVIVDHPDQLVDQEGLRLRAIVPGRGPRGEPPGDLFAAQGQCAAQQFHHLLARGGAAALLHQCGDLPGQHAPVDDGPLVGNARGSLAHAAAFSASQTGR